jgi:hypothetical protein
VMYLIEKVLKLEIRKSTNQRSTVAAGRPIDRLFRTVGHLFDGLLHFALGLIDLPFRAQSLVIGQRSGCFFYAPLDLISFSAHRDAPYF